MATSDQGQTRLNIAAFRGGEGQAASFPIHSMDREYMKACTKAFLIEYTRKYGMPDRVRVWIG